jgi:hypothetical protein
VSYDISCGTCGCPTTAIRSNQRHCHPCAVLKVLSYLRAKYKRARKCPQCHGAFRPASQKDIALCHACDTVARPEKFKKTRPDACVFCRGPVPVGSLHKKICTACMKDPIRQDEVVALLAKQQAERIAEHKD